MAKRGLTRVILTLSLTLVAAACAEEQPARPAAGDQGDTGGEDFQEEAITIAGQEATNRGSEDVTEDSEITVELSDFAFAPTVLEGEAGQSLSVALSNVGMAPHTFTIDDQDVDVELAAGESGDADVTFPESGALVFYCRFHIGGGMLGALSVGGDLAGASAGSGGGGSGGGDSEDENTGPGY